MRMLLLLLLTSFSSVLSLSPPSKHHQLQNTQFCSHNLDIIRRGGVCVLPNFIPPEEICALRTSIAALREQGDFYRSGLSNRQLGDTNEFGASDRLTCTITHEAKAVDRHARWPVEERLEKLRQTLQKTLVGYHNDDSSAYSDSLELKLSEQYYSISPPSSFLPRHMDERHEETKGDKGWEQTSRRSISWLLYLNRNESSPRTNVNHDNNDDTSLAWNASENGGELRLYCRNTKHWCGAHEGDLQVGWLPSSSSTASEFEPVFLDSWKKVRLGDDWIPRSALYRLVTETAKTDTRPRREYLSDPFGSESPSWPSTCANLEPHEFAAALAMQLTNLHHRSSFLGAEQLENSEVVDIAPIGGTLVMFDSVVVPHEVLETKKGERIAMAGWFHEPVQDCPDWYGS